MIRYALACDKGHEFESWFPSGASYDAQTERGLVACAVCGSSAVEKRLMAPALSTRGRKAEPSAAAVPAEVPAGPPAGVEASDAPQPMAVMSPRDVAMRAMFKALREHVVKTSDYVGPSFADEARKMHYGEIEHRSIYGEADAGETHALLEEGIEIHPLPISPDDRN